MLFIEKIFAMDKKELYEIVKEGLKGALNECMPPNFDEYGVADYLAGAPLMPKELVQGAVANLKKQQAESAAKREMGIIPGSPEDKNFQLSEERDPLKMSPHSLDQADMFNQHDDTSDLDRYRAEKDDYRGFEDEPVSPGYLDEDETESSDYSDELANWDNLSADEQEEILDRMENTFNASINETQDEVDPIALAKSNASSKYDSTSDAIKYAGEEIWNTMSPREKEEVTTDLERSFEASLNEDKNIKKVTMDEINKIIKEGVENLHRQALIENRLEQINQELNMMNNPEAWENARTEAKAQLAKKNVAWQEITNREQLMSESKESIQEMNFRDVESMIPIKTPKDTATIEANAQWKQIQKESVSEIMGRAADLMAEAKKKYNDISK